jgi:hypothetical protein
MQWVELKDGLALAGAATEPVLVAKFRVPAETALAVVLAAVVPFLLAAAALAALVALRLAVFDKGGEPPEVGVEGTFVTIDPSIPKGIKSAAVINELSGAW